MKIEWAKYLDNGTVEDIYYESLDKSLYDSQYAGKLFCYTPNCNAEIRFTERTDGTKFFSTMNNQGTSHDKMCPYYLNYEGEVSRRRFAGGSIIGTSVSDEHIINTIRNKSRSLKRRTLRPYVRGQRGTSRRTIDGGEETVSQVVDNGTVGESSLSSRIRITSLNSNFVTGDYLGQRKCIVGKIVGLSFNKNEGYGSIQLENKSEKINAFIPPAFYSDETITTRATLNLFMNIIQQELNRDIELILVCVGMLQEDQNGKGININVISPLHLRINDKRYYDIITSNEIGMNPYN